MANRGAKLQGMLHGEFILARAGTLEFGTLPLGLSEFGTQTLGPSEFGTQTLGPSEFGTQTSGPSEFGTTAANTRGHKGVHFCVPSMMHKGNVLKTLVQS